MKPLPPYPLPISNCDRFNFTNPAKLSEMAFARGDKEEALRQILMAHKLAPHIMEFPATAAVILHDLNRYSEALEWHQKTLAFKIKKPEVYYNIGSTFLALNDIDSAMFYTRKSLNKKPTAMAYNNLGNIYIQLQDFGKAHWSFKKALQMDEQCWIAHFNLGNLLLLYEQYAEGWEEYDYRILVDQMAGKSEDRLPWPYWDGQQDLNGKKIYIEAEQGSGDTFQFMRYLFDLIFKYEEIDITFHVPDHMYDICRRILPWTNLHIVTGKQVFAGDAFDYKLKLLSLARIFFNPRPDYNEPYIFPKSKRQISNGSFHIGLCWRGNPNHKNDINRSLTQEIAEQIPDKKHRAVFWSLQKDHDPIPGTHWVDLSTWDHTLEILHVLDLVITVDTSVAHLAGAMGKETWLMLPKSPDWRWGLNKKFTIWYPSMKLYRQELRGDWRHVIENVSRDLSARLQQRENSHG